MFDPKTGIEVRIKPYGSNDPYLEYPAPRKSTLYAQGRNETFLEAVTDERYVIDVVAHPTFQWQKASHLKAGFYVDGGTIKSCRVLDNPSKNEAVSTTLDSFSNVVDGKNVRCGFTFGSVIIDEDPSFLTQTEENSELSSRGKIEIVIQRGKVEYRKAKKSEMENADILNERFMLPIETSKKVASDNGRSHCLQPVILHEVADHHIKTSTWFDWTPAKDAAGDKILFTFFYTSRIYLEIMEMVPMFTSTNTKEAAINVDRLIPTPRTSIGPQIVAGGSRKRRQQSADLTYVSTYRLGNEFAQDDRLHVKVENEHAAFAPNSSSATNAGHWAKAGEHECRRDEDDEEMPPPKRIKREPTQDLYSATPPPGDRQPGRMDLSQRGTQASQQGTPLQETVLAQVAKAKKKAALQRRLEMLQIQKELEEMGDE